MAREYIQWKRVLDVDIPLKVMTHTLPTKGNLVYEYNPFRNYRLTQDKYLYQGDYYTMEELQKEFKITPSRDNKSWEGVPDNQDEPVLYEKGQLIDFVTNELKFSLDHPVHIVPQYSYDGSVNLIINDGLNIPRLINSRFSATGRNTYEIVDRKGSNDTNIYDQGEQFDIDTSLYKIVNNIPKITFLGTPSGGNLRVGNYHFYFKLADADGNETDFVAESGLVSVFIGHGSYNSVHTGTKNENSAKQVEFKLDNVDSAYDYIYVYYSRYTAENNDNAQYEYKKISKKYSRTSPKLVITGFEETEDISVTDINTSYNIVDAVQTSAVCQNMLFMGNVKKQDIPYEELQDLSLRILPFLGRKPYNPELDYDYNCTNYEESYINPKFIYNNTGYWKEELYCFGIVYILPNGQLTPVFNVRGGINIGGVDSQAQYNGFSNIPIYETNEYGEKKRRFIKYNENNFLIAETVSETYANVETSTNNDIDVIGFNKIGGNLVQTAAIPNENVKGVCSFSPHLQDVNQDDNEIYYVRFFMDKDLKDELRKHVKGFFFVRQTRIPLVLAQGITIGIDKESRTPTIPTAGGILTKLGDNLEKTHVETENINGVNYISEGFLKRYSFTFKKKSSSFWKKIGSIMGVTALVVGAITVGIATAGGGFAAAAATYGTIAAATATATVALGTSLVGAIAAAAVTGVIAATQELGYAVVRIGAKKKLDGKNTKAPSGYKIVEEENSRKITESFEDRIIIKDNTKNDIQGIICPDYTVNQAYYNQIFTGNEHLIKTDSRQSNVIEADSGESYFTNDNRHFYIDNYRNVTIKSSTITKVIGVPDNAKCLGIDNILFKARAGEAEEAWRYSCVGTDTKNEESEAKKINTDIIRGSYGPYLAFLNKAIGPAKIVNIYAPGYDETQLQDYIEIRMNDNSVYNAITDRFDISEYEPELKNDNNFKGNVWDAYRGDCYICQFTQRIVRNFNDPSAPYNDDIVDVNTWKDNYDPDDTEKYEQINLGDVNAVPIGMWVTFQLRSSNNLNIRTLDGSEVDETSMTGHPRGYFPYHPMSVDGAYKKPDSQNYNKGFAKSVSERWNFELPDVPHIKNWFGTRIMYSDIHVNDGYKNGFRIFRGTNYRDYTREYGEIVKLVPFESSLLCVFEHGIAMIPVNERAVAGQGAGGNVYINTSNVLPENPKIISDMFGSQWAESVLKVPGRTGDAPQYVYGVDTVAKKIWRTDGTSIECISDFRVQEFLNNNITLGERELTPKIGIRNVKTHYNAYKRDVMFTFYDNTYGFEEKVWNLCWNELLQKFITFYSWVPSYMENINNVPFSFNRDTSKWIAKLGTSHAENSFADGITLSNVIMENIENDKGEVVTNFKFPFSYINKKGEWATLDCTMADDNQSRKKYIGVLSLSNRILPDSQLHYQVSYSLQRDQYGNYKKFEIVPVSSDNCVGGIYLPDDAMFAGAFMPVYCLKFKTGGDEYTPVFYKDGKEFTQVSDGAGDTFYTYQSLYTPRALLSELYYRNKAKHVYADYDTNKIKLGDVVNGKPLEIQDMLEYPIFKDITGKRPTLPREEMLNADKIVTLLNIKATISIVDDYNTSKLSDTYYNMKAGFQSGTSLIDGGYYESVIGITPRWNLQFLSTDFWKHGQAGLIDIADDIYPTYWYGKQHPFEFECIVVNDPSIHKIFTNLEIVANKAKPESFHYEIIGETYDFAKDKVNMYFRQEAMKALWQYNGADISYNRNFLKTQPRQQPKSADFPHKYYTRQDTINEIEDYYIHVTYPESHDYRHLSGAEIVYYPNRQEYRIWNHAMAVSLDDLSQDDSRSIIAANCQYLEDRWKVTINPILVCYKNEYQRKFSGSLIQPQNSTWAKAKDSSQMLPTLPIYNSPIPDQVLSAGGIDFPGNDVNHPERGKDNALYNLYDLSGYNSRGDWKPLDLTNWLDDVNVYKYNFGEAQNRKEIDVKDKFLKIRIRYSGEELAVIDFLNTVYRISYS